MQIRALPNGARYNPPQLVAIRRNGWSPSIGTGGRHPSERLVAFNRNRWSPSAGAGIAERLIPAVCTNRETGAHLVCGSPKCANLAVYENTVAVLMFVARETSIRAQSSSTAHLKNVFRWGPSLLRAMGARLWSSRIIAFTSLRVW
jgi:hypothetical protein